MYDSMFSAAAQMSFHFLDDNAHRTKQTKMIIIKIIILLLSLLLLLLLFMCRPI